MAKPSELSAITADKIARNMERFAYARSMPSCSEYLVKLAICGASLRDWGLFIVLHPFLPNAWFCQSRVRLAKPRNRQDCGRCSHWLIARQPKANHCGSVARKALRQWMEPHWQKTSLR